MPLQLNSRRPARGSVAAGAIFPHEAWAKLTAYDAAVGYMQATGLPGWLLPFAIAVEPSAASSSYRSLYTRVAAWR